MPSSPTGNSQVIQLQGAFFFSESKISPIWIDKEPNGGIIAGNLYSIGLEVTFADGTKDKTINAGGNLYNCDFRAISTTAQITDFDSDYEMNSKGNKVQHAGHMRNYEGN